jgi:hypothetical protein
METAFVESECYHYVEVPEVTSSASGASSTGISENRFTDAEPVEVEMVANEIAKQKTRVSDSFDTMLARVNGMMSNNEISQDNARLEMMKIDNQRTTEILKIDNSENQLRDKFLSATKDWRNHKEQHTKTVGKCMAVFNSCLGDSARSVIKRPAGLKTQYPNVGFLMNFKMMKQHKKTSPIQQLTVSGTLFKV